MPLYSYKCPQCEKVITLDHGMMDEKIHRCKDCIENPILKKLPGVGAVSFKGGGWGKDAR